MPEALHVLAETLLWGGIGALVWTNASVFSALFVGRMVRLREQHEAPRHQHS